MAGQGSLVVKDQIVFRNEGEAAKALRADRSGARDVGQYGFGLGVIIAVRQNPGQTKDRGAVGCVPDPREGE